MGASELFAPSCSITSTKRRRFLWAAWWTAPPVRAPFRKPDASAGGARTREAALLEAERVAGVQLVEIEPRWARAWARVLVGAPPWPAKKGAGATDATDATGDLGARASTRRTAKEAPRPSVWTLLGVTTKATELELKRAFRKRALETHPDRGGSAEAFREVHSAYREACRRLARKGNRPTAKTGGAG